MTELAEAEEILAAFKDLMKEGHPWLPGNAFIRNPGLDLRVLKVLEEWVEKNRPVDLRPGDRVEIMNAVGDWQPGTVVDISPVIEQYRNGAFDRHRAVRHDGSSTVHMIANHPSVLRPMEVSDGKDVDQHSS